VAGVRAGGAVFIRRGVVVNRGIIDVVLDAIRAPNVIFHATSHVFIRIDIIAIFPIDGLLRQDKSIFRLLWLVVHTTLHHDIS
jgi:hypothetical protein